MYLDLRQYLQSKQHKVGIPEDGRHLIKYLRRTFYKKKDKYKKNNGSIDNAGQARMQEEHKDDRSENYR